MAQTARLALHHEGFKGDVFSQQRSLKECLTEWRQSWAARAALDLDLPSQTGQAVPFVQQRPADCWKKVEQY